MLSSIPVVLIIPRLDCTGPVKGAVSLANSLSDIYSVHLVCLYRVKAHSLDISPGVVVHTLGPSRNSLLSLVSSFSSFIFTISKLSTHPPFVISYCFLPDLVNLLSFSSSVKISSIRANLFKNYMFTYGPILGFFLAVLNYLLLIPLDHVVVLNESMYKSLKFIYPRLSLIPNFVDENLLETFRPTTKPHNEYFDFVFLGSLSNRKRPDLLLQSFAQLTTSHRVRLHFIGTGPLLSQLTKTVDLLHLHGKVIFHGHLDKPYSILASSNVLVLPSESEGTSRAAMESLFLGVPCILRDVDSNSDLLARSGSGLLFSSDFELKSVMEQAVYLYHHRSSTHSLSLLPSSFSMKSSSDLFVSLFNSYT